MYHRETLFFRHKRRKRSVHDIQYMYVLETRLYMQDHISKGRMYVQKNNANKYFLNKSELF